MNTLVDLLEQSARDFPQHTAVTMRVGVRTVKYNFTKLEERAHAYARFMGEQNVKKGDRVVDVLGEAGGWIERQGAPNRAILVRKLPDGRLGAGEISPLRTAVRGDQKGNPLLEDGDIIYIPQVSRMTFTGILNTLFQGSSFVRLILE